MPTYTQTKRYKGRAETANNVRQLSGLFNIISNNLLTATEVLSTDYRIKAVSDLESLSRKAMHLAKELISSPSNLTEDEMSKKISSLKSKMLSLVENLSKELSELSTSNTENQGSIEDLVLAKRLLRESQRGLVTIQD